jgi:uncharacterized membrane protein YsdA (DUF1294 family)
MFGVIIIVDRDSSILNLKGVIGMRMGLIIWLVIINVVAYLVMSDDKRRARQRKERIPERTLFLLAFIGGALGVLIAMNTKRHKTKHMSFRIGIPLLLLLNAVLYGYFLT